MSEQRITVREAARAVNLSEQAIRKWLAKDKISEVAVDCQGRTVTMVLLSEVKRQHQSVRLWVYISEMAHQRLEQIAVIEGLTLRDAVELLIGKSWAQWYAPTGEKR